MNKEFLVALDQGTTSSRTIVFNKEGSIICSSQKPLKQIYPQTGWVEVDLNELWETQLYTLQECLRQIDPNDIEAIGITNQRETIGLWYKNGKPATHAISWQCSRTRDSLQKLKSKEEEIRQITGLPLNPYFSASKLAWLLQNHSLENGELLAGTIDSWLLYKLTGNKNFFTDVSNASRTLLFDIKKLQWSERLLQLFDIPREVLPELKPSQFDFGYTDKKVLGYELPIRSLIGDQQAALYGHNCLRAGEAELTCGTGGFLLTNTGNKPAFTYGLLTSVAWQKENAPATYCQEASILTMGSMIEWMQRIGLIENTKDLDNKVAKAKDNNLLVLPTITGYGSPNWAQNQKGQIANLTANSDGNSILKACLESFAFRVKQVALELPELSILKIGGGLSKSNFFCQLLANLLNIPIVRSDIVEATALGCAFLAASTDIQVEFNTEQKIFVPIEKDVQTDKNKFEEWSKYFGF